MIKKVLIELKELDNSIIKIMNNGFAFCFGIGIIGIVLLLTYNTYSVSYDIYKAGFILVKTSIIFAAQFFACGFVANKLRKGKD